MFFHEQAQVFIEATAVNYALFNITGMSIPEFPGFGPELVANLCIGIQSGPGRWSGADEAYKIIMPWWNSSSREFACSRMIIL